MKTRDENLITLEDLAVMVANGFADTKKDIQEIKEKLFEHDRRFDEHDRRFDKLEHKIEEVYGLVNYIEGTEILDL